MAYENRRTRRAAHARTAGRRGIMTLPRIGSEPLAFYELDIRAEFAGPIPERYNRAAPEATAAQFAAVEAVRQVLREHGFIPVSMGHGSRRTGTDLPHGGPHAT